jgi:hypothetical protein
VARAGHSRVSVEPGGTGDNLFRASATGARAVGGGSAQISGARRCGSRVVFGEMLVSCYSVGKRRRMLCGCAGAAANELEAGGY